MESDWYTYHPSDTQPTNDVVSAPSHYTRWNIEPIDFIRANNLPFTVGNVIKYVMRYDAKNGLEDLKKCRQYLDWVIEDYKDSQ